MKPGRNRKVLSILLKNKNNEYGIKQDEPPKNDGDIGVPPSPKNQKPLERQLIHLKNKTKLWKKNERSMAIVSLGLNYF